MIKRLDLTHFKGFERFTVHFGPETWLVGPNNAGKSTVIAALRTVAHMVRLAKRRNADYAARDGGNLLLGHAFVPGSFGLVEENLRHEFRDVETRIEARFASGAKLVAVWPDPADDLDYFFYLKSGDDRQLRSSAGVRREIPDIGVVPTLSPVEHEEIRLTEDYVKSNLSSRLASRHTRNQLLLLRSQLATSERYDNGLEEFLAWADPWTPDFRVGDLVQRHHQKGVALDVFCKETGSAGERELFWAGDGIQVWIQLLLHLFRNRSRDVVVLDEPDLYLHADLQRRLVRLLETLNAQTIAASHSAEVLVEAPPASVVWVSRERRRAVRAPSERIASDLTAALGSHFNLRLARALRAQAVVFVEGDDMRMLRNVGKTLGAVRFAAEAGIVAVPLKGFSNWEHIEPFSWLIEELLERSVNILVILDRDFRSESQISDVETRLAAAGVDGHVWRRKELESYFLEPSALARRSGADRDVVAAKIIELAGARKERVFARVLSERLAAEVGPNRHMTDVTEAAQKDFDEMWAERAKRPYVCNAKELISDLNGWLQTEGHRTVSARALSAALKSHEVPAEMADVIARAEALLIPR